MQKNGRIDEGVASLDLNKNQNLLTSNRKTEFRKKLMISKRNRKRKTAVKVVADAMYPEKK
jgi:hypothetical protein